MLYVVKHKEYNNPLPKGYKELKVGPLFDGVGDNINDLNLYINEMTALYWIWRNTKEDIVGMVHYRRYFTEGDDFLTLEQAEEELRTHDIIITEPMTFEKTLYGCQYEIDFKDDPQTYVKYLMMFSHLDNGFVPFLKSTNTLNPRNMFVCKRPILEDFCKWVFPGALPIAEKFIREDAPRYTDFGYIRMIGYIMERLLPYWVRKEGLKFKEMS